LALRIRRPYPQVSSYEDSTRHFWVVARESPQEFAHEGLEEWVVVKEEKADIVLLEYFEYVGTREG